MKSRPELLGRALLLVTIGGLTLFLATCASGTRRVVAESTAPIAASPQEVFEERILPIFNSPNPSSCTQCHLAGVDLKNYILPSHEKTFLSLRDQGLIDLDRPEQSKILRMIRMGAQDTPAEAVLHAQVRKAEFDAFSAWVLASCGDLKLRNAPRLTQEELNPPLPSAPVQLFRSEDALLVADARTDKLLDSFNRTIWDQKVHCSNCHQAGGKDNAKHVAKYGERVTWMKDDAKATMNYLLVTKLLDAKQPEKSLLLLKPMAIVEHGGGKKIMPNTPRHTLYLTWLKDYAASQADKPVTDKPKPEEKKPAAERKSIELDVQGLAAVSDNLKLRGALSAVPGVKMIVIDRKPTGPSKVRVFYEDGEPELKALIEAATKAGYKAVKGGS